MKARKPSCAPVETRAQRFSSGAVRPFDTDASVLEAMELVVRLRAAIDAEKTSSDVHARLSALEARTSRQIHRRFSISRSNLALIALARGQRLSRTEREI